MGTTRRGKTSCATMSVLSTLSSNCLRNSGLDGSPLRDGSVTKDSCKMGFLGGGKFIATSPKGFSFPPMIQSEKPRLECMEVMSGSNSEELTDTVQEVVSALNEGVQPSIATGGLGGAYFFKNKKGESIAVVKPMDEEPYAPNNPNGYIGRTFGQPGIKKSVRVGEAAVREVAAFLLDHEGFAKVPQTSLVKVASSKFNLNGSSATVNERQSVPIKMASFQKYVQHDCDASEFGTGMFPVRDVHRIGILDVRIFNLDRHSGNILIGFGASGSDRPDLSKKASIQLNPIDHGFSLPESLESPYFEWQHWPQASVPFSVEELDYIARLDPYAEVAMLRRELPLLRESSLRVLTLSTTLLQLGARAGLTLADIAGIMCSEVGAVGEEPSRLEISCFSAKDRLINEIEMSAKRLFLPGDDSCQGSKVSSGYDSSEFHENDVMFPELELDFSSEGYSSWNSSSSSRSILDMASEIFHSRFCSPLIPSFDSCAVLQVPAQVKTYSPDVPEVAIRELEEAFCDSGVNLGLMSEKTWLMYIRMFERVLAEELETHRI